MLLTNAAPASPRARPTRRRIGTRRQASPRVEATIIQGTVEPCTENLHGKLRETGEALGCRDRSLSPEKQNRCSCPKVPSVSIVYATKTYRDTGDEVRLLSDIVWS